jgi:hypothetical protein
MARRLSQPPLLRCDDVPPLDIAMMCCLWMWPKCTAFGYCTLSVLCILGRVSAFAFPGGWLLTWSGGGFSPCMSCFGGHGGGVDR